LPRIGSVRTKGARARPPPPLERAATTAATAARPAPAARIPTATAPPMPRRCAASEPDYRFSGRICLSNLRRGRGSLGDAEDDASIAPCLPVGEPIDYPATLVERGSGRHPAAGPRLRSGRPGDRDAGRRGLPQRGRDAG